MNDSPSQHVLDSLFRRHEIPNFDRMNQFDAFLPISTLQRLGRLHNVIPLVLGRTSKDLTIGVIEHSTERPRNDFLFEIGIGIVGGLRHERDFEEHGRDEVGAFEEFEIDVHVEGKLSLSFDFILFGGESGITLRLNTLSKEFLDSLRRKDLLQRRLSLLD